MEGSNAFARFFLSVFKQNWKTVVALCGAIFLDFGKTRQTVQKSAEMEGNNTFANFFSSIFKETWKTVVALCGAIFSDFGKLEKRPKK